MLLSHFQFGTDCADDTDASLLEVGGWRFEANWFWLGVRIWAPKFLLHTILRRNSSVMGDVVTF